MPLRAIIGFLWEWIVGKDVRLDKAIKHHKLRLVLFICLIFSVAYNYHVTKRTLYHYNRYSEMKTQVSELTRKNNMLSVTVMDKDKVILNLRDERKTLTSALIMCNRNAFGVKKH